MKEEHQLEYTLTFHSVLLAEMTLQELCQAPSLSALQKIVHSTIKIGIPQKCTFVTFNQIDIKIFPFLHCRSRCMSTPNRDDYISIFKYFMV